MVLIVSHTHEPSTDQIIDWLLCYGVPFIRINPDTTLHFLSLELSSGVTQMSFEVGGTTISLADLTGVWYRRGWFQFAHSTNLTELPIALQGPVEAQLALDMAGLNEFITEVVFERGINSPVDNKLNKLAVLRLASRLGLSTPNTLVTTSKTDVANFRNRHGRIITKNLTGGVFIQHGKTMLQGYTSEVTDDILPMLASGFFPMMFQELLDKAYEVRTFFLNGRMWSSAIFSQSSESTALDFRNYDRSRPNRTPPYVLPVEVEHRLLALMRSLRLTCGSIDLVVRPNDDHVFLEVNPVGQFWQVSHPCNYHIEDEIARSLAGR